MTTDIIHRSKIGLEILIPVILVIGTVTTMMAANLVWNGLASCALVILLLTTMYTGTYYKITTKHHLLIIFCFIKTFDIEIKDIARIKATRELLSAPALSTDRLEINYQGGRVLISPKDKIKFMDDLRKINPKL